MTLSAGAHHRPATQEASNGHLRDGGEFESGIFVDHVVLKYFDPRRLIEQLRSLLVLNLLCLHDGVNDVAGRARVPRYDDQLLVQIFHPAVVNSPIWLSLHQLRCFYEILLSWF